MRATRRTTLALDRTLTWNQAHLLHALREFEYFCNGHRPHQGIANARPLYAPPPPIPEPADAGPDICRRDLWVPEIPVTLCDLGVLVEQAAERVSPENPDICARSRWTRTPGGRALLQGPVRPVRVVVIDVLAENEAEMPFARDQHPVQALAAGAGHPPLGDRVRLGRPDRGLDDPHAGSGKHRVECRSELGVTVPDQELQADSAVLEFHQ